MSKRTMAKKATETNSKTDKTLETLKTLNKLSPMYHSYFGFHPENNTDMLHDCTAGHYVHVDEEDDPEETLKKYFAEGCLVCDEHTGEYFETFADLIKKPYVGKVFSIYYNLAEMIELAEKEIPFDTVIIKYTDYNWYGRLTEWYNQPTKWWKDIMSGKINPYLKQYALPYLKTRSYIHVDEPFMHVTVSAKDKGIPLSYDDILFATRALCLDDRRKSYKVLNADDNDNDNDNDNDIYRDEKSKTLVLEPISTTSVHNTLFKYAF